MDNAIITILDYDYAIVPTPLLNNDNNTLVTIPDDEPGIVPPPDESQNTSKPTSKYIKISDNKPDFEV